ncbi:carbohydrate-binding family 9-like protein [Flavihumibacter sp. CACIAM 22H1]|uniref:carbohydrate-binding family 9-like protein n=1 Tax=Flavihumibacter sp. CACIAM 22H1 TaxID=1812911 RepID=UPI000B048E67|nr:carbohydrate-binding family 9-like protein [Flavihumibacter sp. CACIAM 22H1]
MPFPPIHNKYIGRATLLPLLFLLLCCKQAEEKKNAYLLKKTADFSISGTGTATNWQVINWTRLHTLPNYPSTYSTEFKLLYSSKGLYGLFRCTDSLLTNTLTANNSALYKEDVIEIFLQPDTTKTHYFEYELSPLDYETALLIFNNKGDLNSWQPFEQAIQRKVLHATSVTGGNKESRAAVTQWVAEFFIPFDLLKPVGGAAPKPGDTWKANLYRIDYDKGEALWTWQPNSGNFHEYQHFGMLHFE